MDVLADHSKLNQRFRFSKSDNGTFQGVVVTEVEVGDHWVFILAIEAIRPPLMRGLIYVERKIGRAV